MNKYIQLLFIFSFVILTSCKDKVAEQQKSEYNKLFAEVMKVHDDVMPETNNLYKLKKFAQENIDILPDTSIYVKKLRDAQMNADKADDAMMQWMSDFAVPNGSHEEKMKYLEGQKQSVEDLRALILSTIYDGKVIVNKTDKYIRVNKLTDEDRSTQLYIKN